MSYSDTWGSPRSGGRRHQGVDLISRTGTPLVAVVSGSVRFSQNSLGGNAVWLTGVDGNKYYYAHLSRYEGSSRNVSQGEVIGYVGTTGRSTGPHLHYEVLRDGAQINPMSVRFPTGRMLEGRELQRFRDAVRELEARGTRATLVAASGE